MNLYLEDALPAPATFALAGDARADVLVVGAGFTGLSAALHLAERGVAVIVLEAQEIGYGASGRNGGQVNPGLKHDPDAVLHRFGADRGARMLALAGAAPAYVFELVERYVIACDARRCGTLRAAVHAEAVAGVRASAEQHRRMGAPVEFLEREAVAAATGTARYRGAMLDRRGGALNPLSFARGLARAAIGAGATVHSRSRVEQLERTTGAWRARTAAGSVTAERVLLATNGYSDDLWPSLRRSIFPIVGSIAATAPLPPSIAHGIMPGGQVLYESGLVTVYYRLDAAGRLLIGGRGPMLEIGGPAEVPHLIKYARRLWPQLASIEWTHGWGGRLAITADQYPHVHEPAAGLLIALGYNGRGVALATALGQQLAAHLMDSRSPIDLPITPIQRIRYHGLWPLAVPAAVRVARIRDFFAR